MTEESRNLWVRQEGILLTRDKKQLNSAIYTRELSNYRAHLFLVFPESGEELAGLWEWVDEYVAFHYQSRIRSSIEKSNFYIAYFVTGEVAPDLHARIEQGVYCARKYVFTSFTGGEEAACDLLEQKIFGLELLKSRSEGSGKHRISRIRFCNFRKYAGERVFDFADETERPASFVLLYAPNGSGKTSFTDGVEYALRGEVSRLKKLAAMSDAQGAIYRNRYHMEEDAFVELSLAELADGSECQVYRTIRRVDKSGNDIYAVPPKRGREITGPAGSSEQWNQLILPHDKIDSFITAYSPSERYHAWFAQAEDLKRERESFEKAHKTLRKLLSEKNSYWKGGKDIRALEDLKARRNALKKERENLKAFCSLVEKWNRLFPEESEYLLEVPETLKEENYNALLNRIAALLRSSKSRQDTLLAGQRQLQAYLAYGPELAAERFCKVSEMSEEKMALTDAMRTIRTLESQETQLGKCKSKIQSIQLELMPEMTMQKLEAMQLEASAIYQKAQALDTELIRRLKDMEQSLSQKKTLLRYVQQLLETQPDENLSWKRLSALEIDTGYSQTLQTLRDLWHQKDVEIQELSVMTESRSDKLRQLKEEMRAYLTEHDDSCCCPVCNTRFESWNHLMEQVCRIPQEEAEDFHDRLSALKEEREKLGQTYEQTRHRLHDELLTRQEELWQQTRQMEAEIADLQHQQKALQQQMGQQKTEFSNLKKQRTLLESLLLQQEKEAQLQAEVKKLRESLKPVGDNLYDLKARFDQIDRKCREEMEDPLYKAYLIYGSHSEEELRQLDANIAETLEQSRYAIELLQQMGEEKGIRAYITEFEKLEKELSRQIARMKQNRERLKAAEKEYESCQKLLELKLKDYFGHQTINEIYRKIDPHNIMKNLNYHLEFQEDQPCLRLEMTDNAKPEEKAKDSYQPELYFSTAQLNTVAFSSFFGRALEADNLPIRTVFIDDPIDNFDDMNMLGFADLMRSIIMNTDCQVVMTTHDPKVFHIMERKLDSAYHSSCFLTI